MSKFKDAWESYKADYPNRKTKVIKVNNKKEKVWFLDYHEGVAYSVCLTSTGYTLEKIPSKINLVGI